VSGAASPVGGSGERTRARPALAGLAVVAAVLAVSYARGEDSFVRINDHLDGIVPMYRLLAETEPVLGGLHNRVDALFGGIPRNSLPSTLNLGALVYYVLPPLAAHVVDLALVRAVAFLGLFGLLRRHLLPGTPDWIAAGTALVFAHLALLPTSYLAVAGLPLLLLVLLELRGGRGRAWHWACLALFPFFSSLVFTGFFVLLLLGLLALWDAARERRPPWRLAAAGLLLAAGWAVCEYRVLYQAFLDPDYASHRSAFVRPGGGLRHVAATTLEALVANHRHAPSLQTPFVWLAAALALGAGVRAALRGGPAPAATGDAARPWRVLVVALAACLLSAGAVGVWSWSVTQELVEEGPLAPLRVFNFHRVQWLQPPLFAVAFAAALDRIARLGRTGSAAAAALLVAQGAFALWSTDEAAERRATGLSFRAYYSPALFEEVRAEIGRPPASYRVASFGLTPAIALYNGFQVVDGFVNDYPLAYKARFRRVIAGELAESERLRGHFDGWGGHVDLLSSELGFVSGYGKTLYTKRAARRAVEDLDLDVDALRDLGVAYLLSAVEIRNAADLGLRLERVFERDDSPWQIFLYAVPPAVTAAGRAAP
jgi:hypothetical protein